MSTRIHIRFVVLPALIWLPIALSGCGAPSCGFVGIKIDPQAATIDHSAAPPANGLQLTAVAATIPPGCALTHSTAAKVRWSVSDSAHASISNTHDQTHVMATCLGATTGAATVTATMPSGNGPVRGTATLTCQ